MIEVRFHGRGGQGAVIASSILAQAAFAEGKFVQAFPHYGVERRGAPVAAFTRISGGAIRTKHEIYCPDYLVVLDSTMMDTNIETVDVLKGLKPKGMILLNTDKSPESFLFGDDFKVAAVDASDIAVRHGLGGKSAPIVNTAILGAFARASGIIGLQPILDAVVQKVPLKKEENVAATKEAYEKVRF